MIRPVNVRIGMMMRYQPRNALYIAAFHMLGHYSAGFTLDTYAHITTDAQLKAVQTMGNILSRAV